MTSIVVCGIAGQMPLAGVALHYLQYCLGFRDLGVEVSYLEDNFAWPQHPWRGEPDGTASYTIPWLTELFEAFELPWAYLAPTGEWHGATEQEVEARCARADLILNVSGGTVIRPYHRAAKAIAYVDTDPSFTQVYALQDAGHREWLQEHDLHFTFAEMMGRPNCRIPDAGMAWIPTRQPVWLPFWNETSEVPGTAYTTVMNWSAYGIANFEGEEWGQKDVEFPKILDLPRRTGLEFELALGGLKGSPERLRAAGFRIVDPRPPTRTVWTFRDYISASRAEISVAKQGYVRSRSGWFSERSANYLAAGRPVVAQDTGWSEVLPAGKGLIPFADADEAVAALASVEADLQGHANAARELAASEFDASLVLTKLLSDAGVD